MALKIGNLSDNAGCCITILCFGDKQTTLFKEFISLQIKKSGHKMLYII